MADNGRDEKGRFVTGSKINQGRVHSVARRARHSAAMIGRKLSDEHKAKLRGKICSAEHKKKISDAQKGRISPMKGRKHTAESKEKMSKSMLLRSPLSEESRKKISDTLKGQPFTDERRRNLSNALMGHKPSEESIRKTAAANRGKKRSPESCKKMSVKRLEKFKDPAFVSLMKKAWGIKPNKPETFLTGLLENLYPGEWKYTGDFSFMINGKNPDFVNCNGQKKCIELFGDYWHKGQNPQDRIDVFKPFGFETLVIWEHELKDIGNVSEKIKEFHMAA